MASAPNHNLLAMKFDKQKIHWFFHRKSFIRGMLLDHMNVPNGIKFYREKKKVRHCVKIDRSYKSLSLPSFPLIENKGRFSRRPNPHHLDGGPILELVSAKKISIQGRNGMAWWP